MLNDHSKISSGAVVLREELRIGITAQAPMALVSLAYCSKSWGTKALLQLTVRAK
jgi:hypothetical protein